MLLTPLPTHNSLCRSWRSTCAAARTARCVLVYLGESECCVHGAALRHCPADRRVTFESGISVRRGGLLVARFWEQCGGPQQSDIW